MSSTNITVCQCSLCREGIEHPDQEMHRQMNLFLSRLDESQRRWYVALESKRVGKEGDRVMSEITGMDEKTIRCGRGELDKLLAENPSERIRRPGGGRPAIEKKTQPSLLLYRRS